MKNAIAICILMFAFSGCSGNSGGGSSDDSPGGGTTSPTMFSGVISMASGDFHSCAIKSGGSVYCWGNNFFGQLGRSSDERKPRLVVGLSGAATGITAGTSHSCALIADGTVQCWGLNSSGQLGDGTTTNSQAPVTVVGISGATKVMAGGFTTCALVPGGGGGTSLHKCWGNGGYGVLGNNGNSNSTSPVLTSNFTFGQLSAISNYFGCGIAGGVARCWGTVSNGELGNGTTSTSSYIPVDVSNLSSGMLDLDVGVNHACSVTSSKAVKCWGKDSNGQLGDNTTTLSNVPVQVSGLTSGFDKVVAGDSFSCAFSISLNQVKCWGLNSSGQLGNGMTTDSFTPVDVNGLSGFNTAQVTAGSAFACSRSSDGFIKCWGSNTTGYLGNGTNTNSSIPIDVLE